MAAAEPSLARKLTTLTVLASGTALVTASVAFTLYDRTTYRTALVQRVTTQAQLVAANSASALAFDDPAAARTTLDALRNAPRVVGAVISRADGSTFATYTRDKGMSGVQPLAPSVESPRFEGDRLLVRRLITLEDQVLGQVTIVADLDELAARQVAYLRLALGILVLSLAVALSMSWMLQRSIARSIGGLVQLAREVSRDRDYSRRAAQAGGARELTLLGETFNQMLGEIQTRDRELRDAHDDLEVRVRRRTAELDAANKELEAFSYSVSHDLRAPLRHVSGFAEMLEEHAGPSLDDQGKKYVQTIRSASNRMARLIDDLLDFSRVGRTPLNTTRVNLNTVVTESRAEVDGQIAQAGKAERHIEWRIDPLPDVLGDHAMLRQVFVNLLSNAAKYSSTREHAIIEVGVAERTADEVHLFVRDNGVGFDMRYADKLFGVFQRLHRAEQFEGTGIGLANIRRTILRHGGRVWATAEVDRGATFFVALPVMGDTR